MSHQVQNFEIHAGDDVGPIEITVRDAANNILDVTGATFVFAVSTRPVNEFDTPTRVLTKNSADGITSVDPGNGRIDLNIAAEDTQDLNGHYLYQLQMDLGAVESTVLTGTLTIRRTLFNSGEV